MKRIGLALGRTLAIAAGTSVIGVALFTLILSLLALAQGQSPADLMEMILDWLPPLLIAAFLIVAVAIPLIALPVMVLLRALHLESARAYAGWGAAAGFALTPLFAWGSGPLPAGPMTVAFLIYGAVAGALFYLLFRRHAQAEPAEA